MPAAITLSAPAPAILPDDDKIAGLAKALAHSARLRILRLLRDKRSCICCDIVGEIGLAQSTVSEHLRILKSAGVIVGEIEGPRVCYSLNTEGLLPLASSLRTLIESNTPDAGCVETACRPPARSTPAQP
jgi:ArsR family transcriptional regulator